MIIAPASEVLVRCSHEIYDVVIDMRPELPLTCLTLCELTAENRRALYVPEMFAHGQTPTDEAEVVYQMSEFYMPGYERGYA